MLNRKWRIVFNGLSILSGLSVLTNCSWVLCTAVCVHTCLFPLPTDKAKVSNCRVIVHCLAGISRSATIAIAYIMKTMGLSSDDAYRYTLYPTLSAS